MNVLAERVERAYVHACRLDVAAYKPGNVSLYAAGHGMHADDFLASASASAAALADPAIPLGERVFRAVTATQEAVGCNTNLGIVLLAAPMAQGLFDTSGTGSLADRVKRVLSGTTREDAEWVYRAIRLANPGGLGRVARHDVAAAPAVSLREAMRAGAARDRIAHLYVTDFSDIFQYGAARYVEFQGRWQDDGWATTALYLDWLSRVADSHVLRKQGRAAADWAGARARRLGARLWRSAHPQSLLKDLHELDAEMKQAGINPGTTADMIVASIMAVELERLCGSGTSSAPEWDRGDRDTARWRDATF